MNTIYKKNELESFLFQSDDYFNKYREQKNNNCNNLKEKFFSKNNIDIIQNKLINEIKKQSKGKYIIGYQKNEHLIQIMEDIFKTYYGDNINDLNDKVVIFCTPYIFNQIASHLKWQSDSNTPLIPLPLPETTSITGKKSLPSTLLI